MSTGKRRQGAQLARDRRNVAHYYLQGWLQADIGTELNISQATVSRDLAWLHDQWTREGLNNYNEAKAREVAKIDVIEREYWTAWQKSKQSKVEIEERPGDPRYLAGVITCVKRRCELLGLDAPDTLTLKGDKDAPIEFIVGGVDLVKDI